MRRRDVALALLPPALWAVVYAIAKPAMLTFPPIFLLSMVYAITGLSLFRASRGLHTPLWALVAAATLGCSVQSALIFSGITLVPAATAILTVQSQVPFAVVAAWAIGQETMNVRRLAGIALALAGIAIVVGLPDGIGQLRGLLLIVLGTLSWGISQAIIRTRSTDRGSQLMGAMSVIAAPQMLALSLLLETGQVAGLAKARLLDWAAVIVLAFGGYVVAYTIWYGLLRRYRVDEVAPFTLLMPIFGVLAPSFFLASIPPSSSWPEAQ